MMNLNASSDTEYNRQIEAQIAQHSDSPIHLMPPIADWLNHKVLGPRLTEIMGSQHVSEIYAIEFCAAVQRTGLATVVSLGAGDASEEIKIAEAGRRMGLSPFKIVCLELSPILVERGQAAAKKAGLGDVISLQLADLNKPLQLSSPVAGFMAHHALHHMLSLELLFEQIALYMHPEGSFVTFDMIGRNGHMRWPEVLGPIRELWRKLPSHLRQDHSQNREDLWFDDWDCSIEGFEGIRAQDILPLLLKTFRFDKFMAWGGLTDIFIDRRFGFNFDPRNDLDRRFIASVQAAEDRMTEAGSMRPTQMAAVMRLPTASSLNSPPRYFQSRTAERMVRLPEQSLPVVSLAACAIDIPYPPFTSLPPLRVPVDTLVHFGAAYRIGRAMLRWGWCDPDAEFSWAFGQSSGLTFIADQNANILSIQTIGYVTPKGGPQLLTILVNSQHAATVEHREMGAMVETHIHLSEMHLLDRRIELEFCASRPRRPDVDGGPDKRPLSFGLVSISTVAARPHTSEYR